MFKHSNFDEFSKPKNSIYVKTKWGHWFIESFCCKTVNLLPVSAESNFTIYDQKRNFFFIFLLWKGH